ncbi:DUF305 domain-containing protein [Actinomadura rugatobispora]|uniref:DUF305 domain-containing protein n=1 Tax=Actinomadura rugatobispora TaxID=1994 RepID=A0ABW0ZR24_9ACTN|nr:DUF305 domain-containing protein [Actinomadura rugatobispora]
MKTRILAIGATLLIGATAAACGGDDGTASGPVSPSAGARTAQHNQQDVTFAQMMIPHHRQALEMSEAVAAKSTDAEVRRLAQQIEKAQGPEIATMTGWLRTWGATVPSENGSGHVGGHGGHGGGGEMPGMMTERQMADLEKAAGAARDRMFLTMMIEHHEGAIAMARDEQAKGAHPDARRLAGTIITAQQAEIAAMRALLKR